MKGQPTLWPIGESEEPYSVPEGYSWRYLERLEFHKANLVHPAVAAVMAAEDVAHEEAAAIRRDRLLRPQLWDEPVYLTKPMEAA